jgi:hypothetical protein
MGLSLVKGARASPDPSCQQLVTTPPAAAEAVDDASLEFAVAKLEIS